MELDELKQAWLHTQWRQDEMQTWMREDLRGRGQARLASTLRRSMFVRVLELTAWIAFTVWAASFWVDHRHVTHWLVIGLILHLYGIAGIWASVTQMLFLSRLCLFDAPVLVLQRRLAQLRRLRVWCTLGLGLPWWCLWLLVSLAAAYQFYGVDGWAGGSAWVMWNMGVGIAGMLGSLWLARHLAGREIRSPMLRRIIDDMSGCNLRRAAGQLDELARFERG